MKQIVLFEPRRRFNLRWTYAFCLVLMIKFSICFPRMPRKEESVLVCIEVKYSDIFDGDILGNHLVFIKPIYLAPVVNTKETSPLSICMGVLLCVRPHKRGEKHIPQGAIGAYLHTHCTRAHSKEGALYIPAQRDKYENNNKKNPTFALSANTYISLYTEKMFCQGVPAIYQ